jgi:hypothetical protein
MKGGIIADRRSPPRLERQRSDAVMEPIRTNDWLSPLGGTKLKEAKKPTNRSY